MPFRHRRSPSRAALVTGATGGIGEALARALPADTRLVLTGRDESALARLEAELSSPERTVTVVAADLSDESGRSAVVDAAQAAEIDLIVNNAGLGDYGPFLDSDMERNIVAIRVNAEAPLALVHALLPDMLARAEFSGSRAGVINVSSSLAFLPVPTLAVYAATKAFLLSFGESLAAELQGEPVDVLTACPGATKTGFGSRAGFEGGSFPLAMSPDRVAREILAALGRQTTVLIGPASATAFTGVAVARSIFGQAFMQASRVAERLRPS